MKLLAFALMAVALGGCVSVSNGADSDEPLKVRPAGECDASNLQSHIGHTASAQSGTKLLELSGASTLRWVPPRTAVTMDYRPDRLTVSYDDDMAITRITCG